MLISMEAPAPIQDMPDSATPFVMPVGIHFTESSEAWQRNKWREKESQQWRYHRATGDEVYVKRCSADRSSRWYRGVIAASNETTVRVSLSESEGVVVEVPTGSNFLRCWSTTSLVARQDGDGFCQGAAPQRKKRRTPAPPTPLGVRHPTSCASCFCPHK